MKYATGVVSGCVQNPLLLLSPLVSFIFICLKNKVFPRFTGFPFLSFFMFHALSSHNLEFVLYSPNLHFSPLAGLACIGNNNTTENGWESAAFLVS